MIKCSVTYSVSLQNIVISWNKAHRQIRFTTASIIKTNILMAINLLEQEVPGLDP